MLSQALQQSFLEYFATAAVPNKIFNQLLVAKVDNDNRLSPKLTITLSYYYIANLLINDFLYFSV
jgi:hypothetical protein